MLYGLLFALVGLLGGGVAVLYYRHKQAAQLAQIVGLNSDILSLKRDLLERNNTITKITQMVKSLEEDLARIRVRDDQLLKDTQHDRDTLRKKLQRHLASDPDALAATLGELFPSTKTDGDRDSHRGEASGGTGTP